MKKIRFATAILDFSRKKGGAESYLIDLCTRMAGEEYEVHVYAERWDPVPDIHFHRIKTVPFPKSLRLLSFAARATREMRSHAYDIRLGVGNTLEANVLQPHGGVHWAWFWRSLRSYDHPVLWALKLLGRMISPKQWASGYIEDAAYRDRGPAGVIAISDMVKQDMIRWYGIAADRIAVVYNGVDLERFHPRNRRYRAEVRTRHQLGDSLLILFVSNNFRMKGLRFLLEALAALKKGHGVPFRLLILGRDRMRPYCALARDLEISEEVVFAGATEEIEKYYGSADLLIHPSFYDACSLTVLEALASGLPVITTSCNGASGIMTQGREGFVIADPRHLDTLGQSILFFCNAENRQKAAVAARSLAESYSAERNWREMKHFFEKTTSKGSALG
jgi:UDP-glucose:(heptosyl)LPS alpha-1,3-glucosyltransferase